MAPPNSPQSSIFSYQGSTHSCCSHLPGSNVCVGDSLPGVKFAVALTALSLSVHVEEGLIKLSRCGSPRQPSRMSSVTKEDLKEALMREDDPFNSNNGEDSKKRMEDADNSTDEHGNGNIR